MGLELILFDNEEIVKYQHHGVEVSVKRRLKSKHKEYCLCYKGCKFFKPEDRRINCLIANTLFEICVTFHIATPVWECPSFEPKE